MVSGMTRDKWDENRRNRERFLEREFSFTTLDSHAAVRGVLDAATSDLLALGGPMAHEDRIMRALTLGYLADVALRALKAGEPK